MKRFKDIKRIANKMAQIHRLAEKLKNELDCEGIEWNTAVLISGLQGKSDGLYQDGVMIAEYVDDYYCAQSQGYASDYYYGHLYFKTDVPGQYVRVWFECC